MANTVGELIIQMAVDLTEMRSGLQQATAEFTAFVDLIKRSAATIGAALSVDALVEYGKRVNDLAIETQKMADRLDISVESFQALKTVAIETGTSTEALQTGLYNINRRLAEAAQGSGSAQLFFHRLNTEWLTSSGAVKDAGQALSDMVAGFNKLNPADRAQALRQMGRGAQDMALMLKMGREEFDKLREEASQDVFREDQLKIIKDMNTAYAQMTETMLKLATRILIDLAPVLKGLFDLLKTGIQWVSDFADMWVHADSAVSDFVLNKRLETAKQQLADLQKQANETNMAFSFGGGGVNAQLKSYQDAVKAAEDRVAAIQAELDRRKQADAARVKEEQAAPTPIPTQKALIEQQAAAAKGQADIRAAMAEFAAPKGGVEDLQAQLTKAGQLHDAEIARLKALDQVEGLTAADHIKNATAMQKADDAYTVQKLQFGKKIDDVNIANRLTFEQLALDQQKGYLTIQEATRNAEATNIDAAKNVRTAMLDEQQSLGLTIAGIEAEIDAAKQRNATETEIAKLRQKEDDAIIASGKRQIENEKQLDLIIRQRKDVQTDAAAGAIKNQIDMNDAIAQSTLRVGDQIGALQLQINKTKELSQVELDRIQQRIKDEPDVDKRAALETQYRDTAAKDTTQQIQLETQLRNLVNQPINTRTQSYYEIDRQVQQFGSDVDSVTLKLQADKKAIDDLIAAHQEIPQQLQDNYNQLKAIQEIQNGIRDAFSAVSSAMDTFVSDMMSGTVTVSDAFKKMGRSIAQSLIQDVVKQGMQMVEKAVIQLVAKLAALGFSGFAGGGAGAGVSGLGAGIDEYGLPLTAAAKGGVVTKPTLTLLGESGPEVVIPLGAGGGKPAYLQPIPTQTAPPTPEAAVPAVGGGPLVEINIDNQHPTADVTQQQQQGPNGREIYNIVVKQIRQAAQTGDLQSIMAPYQLRRVPTQR